MFFSRKFRSLHVIYGRSFHALYLIVTQLIRAAAGEWGQCTVDNLGIFYPHRSIFWCAWIHIFGDYFKHAIKFYLFICPSWKDVLRNGRKRNTPGWKYIQNIAVAEFADEGIRKKHGSRNASPKISLLFWLILLAITDTSLRCLFHIWAPGLTLVDRNVTARPGS